MPSSTPVVNGTAERPASSSTRSRTAGSLSGEPKCGPPGSDHSRVAVVSSIMPIDAETGLSRWISSQVSTPGVEVGEQAGLLEHPDRHRPQVAQRRVEAVRVQPLGGDGPAVLGAVAEGEQRLLAAHRRAGPRDVQHLVGGEERRLALRAQLPGRGHERAVVAAVAAQVGERDEHLAAVGDHARAAGRGQPGVAHAGGRGQQPVEGLAGAQAAGVQQRLGLGGVEGHAALGAGERAAQRGLGGCGQRAHGPVDASRRSLCTRCSAARSARWPSAGRVTRRGGGRRARSAPRPWRPRPRPRRGRRRRQRGLAEEREARWRRTRTGPSADGSWKAFMAPAPQAVGGQQDPRDRADPRDAVVAQRLADAADHAGDPGRAEQADRDDARGHRRDRRWTAAGPGSGARPSAPPAGPAPRPAPGGQ